ncbi:MAG: DNA polymerase IV [Acidimicrobiales bacterium]|nr:DNA polymerase IV [Acidimicrobiales bacterium]RZV47140.1 MAG: DNA polymerase IV [Acidimicrobiales bacterium]
MDRTILHVDMDAFFVSVELVRRPELRGKPVVVGGTGARGVVAAASYEARAFGVHSAMPSTQAQRLCPDAVFLSGDHALYGEVSERVMKVFHDVTPLVEPLSLDEAFLDVTGARRLHGDAHQIARYIRTTIWDNEHLTCSVGIAPTKFLAKLSSEQAKPKASPTGPVFGRGVFEVEPGRELEFLHPLPVRALWGVGKATATRLAALGVETVADLAHTPLDTLERSLGTASGRHLHALANGVDAREVEVERETKSISHEETFAHDLTEAATLDTELVRQCDAVAQRLRDSGLTARTAQIKVRFGDFNTITRRLTAPQPFTSGMDLLAMARELFATVDPTQGIRLLGVGVANLSSGGGEQLALNLDEDVERTTTDDLLDDVRTRFGVGSIGPASAAVRGELRVKRRGQQQWGPNQSES